MEITILITESISNRAAKTSFRTITTDKTEKEVQSIVECLRNTWYLNVESIIKTDSRLKAEILKKLLV